MSLCWANPSVTQRQVFFKVLVAGSKAPARVEDVTPVLVGTEGES